MSGERPGADGLLVVGASEDLALFWRTTLAMKIPFLDRFSHKQAGASGIGPVAAGPAVVRIDATALSRVFSAPMWLRDLGLLAWFLVGVGLVLFGLVWLLGITSTIVDPVIVGAILATVAGPLVTKMQRRGIPRAAGAGIVLLGLIALGIVIGLLVFGGLYEQSSEIKAAASEAVDKVQSWLDDVGIQNTDQTADDVKSGTSKIGATLLKGVADGIQA